MSGVADHDDFTSPALASLVCTPPYLTGIHANIIDVQATVVVGAPGFAITGVPATGIRWGLRLTC